MYLFVWQSEVLDYLREMQTNDFEHFALSRE